MRVHLVPVAAAVLATTSLALVVPASASASDPVRPGTYVITNPEGRCLRTGGDFNEKVTLGGCDTRWKVAPGDDKGSVVIRHADTGNCMAYALERIYPPRVATVPCEVGGTTNNWLVREAEAGRVTIATPQGGGYVTETGTDRPLVVLPGDEGGRRLWTFALA
ncbi:hypothetical protein [Streptosporangium longisporum]|uniref:Ricin B lectin domain-containing protein n=1 Tax=Streptosporangium longisporum TaxID=46187 RepID=A0ABN3Y2M2_9ACTN